MSLTQSYRGGTQPSPAQHVPSPYSYAHGPYPTYYPTPPPIIAHGYGPYCAQITPPAIAGDIAAESSSKRPWDGASSFAASAIDDATDDGKRRRREKLKWKNDSGNYQELGSDATMSRKAMEVEALLHDVSRGSEGVATDIIDNIIKKRLSDEAEEKIAIDLAKSGYIFNVLNVFNSLKKWTHKPKHSSHSGAREAVIQNGINFLSVGSVYDRKPGTTDKFFTDFLGISSGTLHRCEEHADAVQGDDEAFHRTLGGYHTDSFNRLQQMKRTCVSRWQHSYEGSFLNTLSQYGYKVLDLSNKLVTHPQRCWHECGINRAYQRFRESAEYAQFKLTTGRKTCETKFRELLCKCTVDPGENSCVDPIYSQINHYCRAILDALHFISAVKEAKAECDCKYCDEAGENGEDIMAELQKRPEDLISSICCKPVEQPDLKAPNEPNAPKMTAWKCIRGECADCGLEKKFNSLKCETLNSCEVEVPVMVWKDAPRDSGATQYELSSEKMTMKDLVMELGLCLGSSRPHYGREKWTARARKLHEQLLTSSDILIQADFSATVDLRASEADNSSQDNHAVLLCMTVSYNFRSTEIDIKNDNGEITGTEVYYTCDTDHWNFWGPSGGKCKKNDHIFYNSCKKHAIKYYQDYLAGKNITLQRVKTWTDNCPGQFGCVQTYRDIAKSDEEFGILSGQYFAEKYCFKSVVDSVGKVSACIYVLPVHA